MKGYGKGLAAALMLCLLTGCSAENGARVVWVIFLAIPAIFLLLLSAMETRSYLSYCKRQRRKGREPVKKLKRVVW